MPSTCTEHPAANADRVLWLESRIARLSWTASATRDVVKTYNAMTVAELERFAPGFPWRPFLAAAGVGATRRYIVAEKSAFPPIAATFAQTPWPTLTAWAAFRVAAAAAPLLSTAFRDESFDMFDRTISGKGAPMDRWKQGVYAAAGGIDASDDDGFGTIRWIVGELYGKHHFPAENKMPVDAISANLLAAFRARIGRVEWMARETKEEAIRKLDRLKVMIGQPAKYRDHAGLRIVDDDLVGNIRRAANAEWLHRVRQLASPVDKDEWTVAPQVNQGFNRAYHLDIILPAGLLQAPVFQPDADPAINYGAIGSYIAHEITHAFDDQGRHVDSRGKLRNWWTKNDARMFNAQAEKLVTQDGRLQPVPEEPAVRVNGRLTLGENIADLGGVATALEAYRRSLGGTTSPTLDGLTGEQRFFLGWAQAWRSKASSEFLKNQVATDPHTPRQFRVDGVVRNLAAPASLWLLHCFPAYAPEINPAGHVWTQVDHERQGRAGWSRVAPTPSLPRPPVILHLCFGAYLGRVTSSIIGAGLDRPASIRGRAASGRQTIENPPIRSMVNQRSFHGTAWRTAK